MDRLYSAFKSRTNWMFLLFALYTGLEKQPIPEDLKPIIGPIMALLGIVFRTWPKQKL